MKISVGQWGTFKDGLGRVNVCKVLSVPKSRKDPYLTIKYWNRDLDQLVSGAILARHTFRPDFL